MDETVGAPPKEGAEQKKTGQQNSEQSESRGILLADSGTRPPSRRGQAAPAGDEVDPFADETEKKVTTRPPGPRVPSGPRGPSGPSEAPDPQPVETREPSRTNTPKETRQPSGPRQADPAEAPAPTPGKANWRGKFGVSEDTPGLVDQSAPESTKPATTKAPTVGPVERETAPFAKPTEIVSKHEEGGRKLKDDLLWRKNDIRSFIYTGAATAAVVEKVGLRIDKAVSAVPEAQRTGWMREWQFTGLTKDVISQQKIVLEATRLKEGKQLAYDTVVERFKDSRESVINLSKEVDHKLNTGGLPPDETALLTRQKAFLDDANSVIRPDKVKAVIGSADEIAAGQKLFLANSDEALHLVANAEGTELKTLAKAALDDAVREHALQDARIGTMAKQLYGKWPTTRSLGSGGLTAAGTLLAGYMLDSAVGYVGGYEPNHSGTGRFLTDGVVVPGIFMTKMSTWTKCALAAPLILSSRLADFADGSSVSNVRVARRDPMYQMSTALRMNVVDAASITAAVHMPVSTSAKWKMAGIGLALGRAENGLQALEDKNWYRQSPLRFDGLDATAVGILASPMPKKYKYIGAGTSFALGRVSNLSTGSLDTTSGAVMRLNEVDMLGTAGVLAVPGIKNKTRAIGIVSTLAAGRIWNGINHWMGKDDPSVEIQGQLTALSVNDEKTRTVASFEKFVGVTKDTCRSPLGEACMDMMVGRCEQENRTTMSPSDIRLFAAFSLGIGEARMNKGSRPTTAAENSRAELEPGSSKVDAEKHYRDSRILTSHKIDLFGEARTQINQSASCLVQLQRIVQKHKGETIGGQVMDEAYYNQCEELKARAEADLQIIYGEHNIEKVYAELKGAMVSRKSDIDKVTPDLNARLAGIREPREKAKLARDLALLNLAMAETSGHNPDVLLSQVDTLLKIAKDNAPQHPDIVKLTQIRRRLEGK